MTDLEPAEKKNSTWLWIAILVLFAVVALFFWFDPEGDADETEMNSALPAENELTIEEEPIPDVPVNMPEQTAEPLPSLEPGDDGVDTRMIEADEPAD